MNVGIGTPTLWIGFILFVLLMLALDLGVFHRRSHAVSMREAAVWSIVWITTALSFNLLVYRWFGRAKAEEFLAGYLVEKALSVDNLFVFLVLFSYFSVPARLQHRVLYWGILMAIVLRALFIVAGAAAVHRFHWILFVFGVFLVFTGGKLLFAGGDGEVDPENNRVLKLFRRFVPMVSDYRDHHFVVRENGKRFATPLLLVLVTVEASDVVFAVDSIPAIFGVTTDPFIVFTSNIFAILGLRALFFLLAGLMDRFHYLKYGLGLVLAFIGAKMLIEPWFQLTTRLSLAVIGGLLVCSVLASSLFPPAARATAPAEADDPHPDDPATSELPGESDCSDPDRSRASK